MSTTPPTSSMPPTSSTPVAGDFLVAPEVVRQVHRMSVEAYHRLGEQGLIEENTELIRGVVIEKMSKSPLHVWLTSFLADWLCGGVGTGWWVRTEHPLTLSDSEPEPDVTVVPGSRDDYRTHHPNEATLAIEIAISSEKLDREKALIYAEAGFPEFWLVLPEKQAVEVHRNPAEGVYGSVTVFGPADSVSPTAFPGLSLRLSELFTPSP